MGGLASKETATPGIQNANNKMEIILDEGVKKQIDKLSTYVGYFNKSDVNSLIRAVEEFGSDLELSTGEKYNFQNVKNFVKTFHNDILTKISTDSPALSDNDKKTALKEKLSDSKLPDYLKSVYDDKLFKLKEDVMKSPFLANESKVKSDIGDIFQNVSVLKSKYKYFEYKYIQLNLFMVIFIQHVFNTMNKFINTVIEHTVNEDKKKGETVSNLVNLLVKIMNQAELNIDKEDFALIDKMMSMRRMKLNKSKHLLQPQLLKQR